ncbi:serine/threonine protein kinase [Rhodobacter calidifons]|uniref:Serine/threonine protein kinase n=1 Tax=Rhodobacter calidifons TaxID=2715277 RepID=A0ABX0G679_9RHOB|nr:serine/threonine-protein kinase [Rhodobacter calidifons]NHB76349.1 serine/threonine protein kinase [Rhodobacter calidifons]
MKAAALKIDRDDAGPGSEELPAGTKLMFGQYTIKSFVNSGGFGIVYLAIDSLNRTVVIKECFPSSFCRRVGLRVGARSRAQQEDFRSAVRQFVQEAVTLSQLHHPNIVKVHQVFECNDTAYMAMDHIDGYDLLQTVEGSAPPLRPKEIMSHLMAMLDAVGYVHAQGLLHRDISPDNMIVDPAKGQPVLIDFGASRKEVTRKSRVVSGLRVVKDGYSPQEFYVTGSTQAPCSDLYALAASFYHLISGETPRTSQERLAALAGREGDPLRPLAGRFRGYPPEFLRAIDKAMAIFPRDRLQSVDEWRAMLGLPAQAAVATPVAAPNPAAPAPAAMAPRAVVVPGPGVAPAGLAARFAEIAKPPAAPEPQPVLADGSAPSAGTAPEPAPVSPPLWREVIAAWRRSPALLGGGAVVLLALVGLLALPKLLPADRGPAPEAAPAIAQAAEADAAPVRNLTVVNALRLPNGMTFEINETTTGTQTVVAEIPPGVETDLKPGDVLLIYSASGEMLGTGTALRDILQREFGQGVTTYSFVVRRGTRTVDAGFRLGVAG